MLLHPSAQVVAIADSERTSLDLGEALLREAGEDVVAMCSSYSSDKDLLSREDVDVVIIATPNHTHFDILRQAMASGKHILCEKPLCTTIHHCLEIAELHESLPEDQRGLVWVGMEYRYMRPLQRVARELCNDTVGSPRMMTLREHRFPFLVKVGNWNRFNANTGGTLVEKACHFFGARPAPQATVAAASAP